MPMLHYFFSLPNVWSNMLQAWVDCYRNASIHFGYVLFVKNRYTPLNGTGNISGFARMPPNPYLPLDLELVLVRNMTKPSLLDDLPMISSSSSLIALKSNPFSSLAAL
jgi:hypothetical protein